MAGRIKKPVIVYNSWEAASYSSSKTQKDSADHDKK
jgi:hypothetical protein